MANRVDRKRKNRVQYIKQEYAQKYHVLEEMQDYMAMQVYLKDIMDKQPKDEE